jgi:hypothetical protein
MPRPRLGGHDEFSEMLENASGAKLLPEDATHAGDDVEQASRDEDDGEAVGQTPAPLPLPVPHFLLPVQGDHGASVGRSPPWAGKPVPAVAADGGKLPAQAAPDLFVPPAPSRVDNSVEPNPVALAAAGDGEVGTPQPECPEPHGQPEGRKAMVKIEVLSSGQEVAGGAAEGAGARLHPPGPPLQPSDDRPQGANKDRPAAPTAPRPEPAAPSGTQPPVAGPPAAAPIPAAQQLTQAVIPAVDHARTVLQAIAERPSATSVVRTLQIGLHPQDLGRLRVTLRMSGESLDLRVETETVAALASLERDKAVIGKLLQDAGVAAPLGRVELSLGRFEPPPSGNEGRAAGFEGGAARQSFDGFPRPGGKTPQQDAGQGESPIGRDAHDTADRELGSSRPLRGIYL